MSGLHRKGTMLTADEMAAAPGGTQAAPPQEMARELGYPQNPAGPIAPLEPKFNRK